MLVEEYIYASRPERYIVPRPKLSKPRAASLGAVACRKLTDQGISSEDAAWITTMVLKLHDLTEGMDYSLSQEADRALFLLEELGKTWKQTNGDRNAAMGKLLHDLAVNHIPRPRKEPTAEQTDTIKRLQVYVDTCQNHGVDFAAAFPRVLALQPPSSDPERDKWIMWPFAIINAITAADMVFRENFLAISDQPDSWDSQHGYGNRNDYENDPASLPMWLEFHGACAAEHLLEGISDLDLPDFIRLAQAFDKLLRIWPRWGARVTAKSFFEQGDMHLAISRCVLAEADRREASFKVAPDALKHVFIRFAWMAINVTVEWMPSEFRARLIHAAADEIGRLRPLLRRASADDTEKFKQLEPHFNNCVIVLFELGSLWQATKPLLLAFRATNARAVGLDLRYWPTNKADDPPKPWEMIPRSLMNLLHHYMGREQADDPQLDKYRAEFALFCLERLKTRKSRSKQTGSTENGQVESDPVWREGFIQAARALCVNPKGKGHHVLNWMTKNDPDNTVREVAMKAYAELRHQPSLPKGLSPRRAVFDAFWWLRQAHLTSLGEVIDHDGANHTREEEARRTTEQTPK